MRMRPIDISTTQTSWTSFIVLAFGLDFFVMRTSKIRKPFGPKDTKTSSGPLNLKETKTFVDANLPKDTKTQRYGHLLGRFGGR